MRTNFFGTVTIALLFFCFSCQKNTLIDIFPVKVGDRWGYVNTKGKYIQNPLFDEADFFSCGVARFVQDGRVGYINEKGKIVIPPLNLRGTTFSEDKAFVVKEEGIILCIDKAGKVLFSLNNVSWVSNYHEGFAKITIPSGEMGYINSTGQIVLEPKYKLAGNFSEGLAYVILNKQSGYINKQGDFIILTRPDFAYEFHDNMVVNNQNGARYGFLDQKGNVTIPYQFDVASEFKEGFACVRNGLYGYIDKNGDYIINPQFDKANSFSNGMALVRSKGKYGYIDTKGNQAISFQFENGCDFIGDYAFVQDSSGKYGLIRKDGSYSISPQFSLVKKSGEVVDCIGAQSDNPNIYVSNTPENEKRSIHNIDILVELEEDGGGWITQQWDVSTSSREHEYYIPLSNLGTMFVSHFSLSEDGRVFQNLEFDWDINLQSGQKKEKCGVVRKNDGVELCWGTGDGGRHLWKIRYHLSGIVNSFDEADAIHMQFINKGLKPAAKHARLTIVPSFNCPTWTYDNTRVWGFGCYGEIHVIDGKVVLETSLPMTSDNSMIALVKFNKGLFTPTNIRDGSFQELLSQALYGSSYAADL